ncbi:hypothetical protein R3P38DRAFT_2868125 [Favolaschia claudopus]|uniref:FIST domain-containing protein n=1 Tax=Favolaschia claudopus TaxID=2862362 RepID=A0AAW0DBE9_9AGAR
MPFSTSFRTVVARSPAALLFHLSRVPAVRDKVLLFALTPNAPSSELSLLVQKLTTLSPYNIGCLSEPLPGQYDGLVSCSFALFDLDSCFPFHSRIPGRASPQVGRRHSFRHKHSDALLDQKVPSGNVGWGTVWDQSLANTVLPDGLESANPDGVGTIIYFTDAAPEGLSNALTRFPGATKLGLFAASTPFITGRPVTLFKNDKIYDSGAVGLALKHSKPDARVQFLDMKPLSAPMLVTQSEGNLVISLDNKNPTQLLLSAIRAAGLETDPSNSFKDNEDFALAAVQDEMPHQMCTIMSGDPSRGTIALRSMSAPVVNTRVQFFHRPRSTATTLPQDLRHTLSFAARPSMEQSSALPELSSDVLVLDDTFLAASEGGFILSRSEKGKGEAAWSCAIPGSLATLQWPKCDT